MRCRRLLRRGSRTSWASCCFQRTTRSVSPTQAALALLPHVRALPPSWTRGAQTRRVSRRKKPDLAVDGVIDQKRQCVTSPAQHRITVDCGRFSRISETTSPCWCEGWFRALGARLPVRRGAQRRMVTRRTADGVAEPRNCTSASALSERSRASIERPALLGVSRRVARPPRLTE